MPTWLNKLVPSLFPNFLDLSWIRQPENTDLSFSFLSELLLCCFQSATWFWSPAMPVTCLAVWTGSTSRSMRQKITWWFCARRRWPLNRSEACPELMHKESRLSRANRWTKKQQQQAMKACPYSRAALFQKFCPQLTLNRHIFCLPSIIQLLRALLGSEQVALMAARGSFCLSFTTIIQLFFLAHLDQKNGIATY